MRHADILTIFSRFFLLSSNSRSSCQNASADFTGKSKTSISSTSSSSNMLTPSFLFMRER